MLENSLAQHIEVKRLNDYAFPIKPMLIYCSNVEFSLKNPKL
jgi:hypothetical protein